MLIVPSGFPESCRLGWKTEAFYFDQFVFFVPSQVLPFLCFVFFLKPSKQSRGYYQYIFQSV